jgi:hypothetical protein
MTSQQEVVTKAAKLAMAPLGVAAAFLLWRSSRRVPLSKVASTAQIGRMRNASLDRNLSSLADVSNAQALRAGSRGGAVLHRPQQQRSDSVSPLSTGTLLSLLFETLNSRHLRGGLPRVVAVSVVAAVGTRWLLQQAGAVDPWSLRRLTLANLLIGWFLYWRRNIVEMPVVQFHRGYYQVSLVLRSKLSQTPFRPVPWLVSHVGPMYRRYWYPYVWPL